MIRAALVSMALLVPAVASATNYEKATAKALERTVTIRVVGMGITHGVFDLLLSTSAPQVKKIGFIGSGSVITADGVILTCDHLFTENLTDRQITVIMSSGHAYRALVVAEDKKMDLAVLKVFPVHPMKFFTLGRYLLQRGQPVMSFGAPLAISKTATFGYVGNTNINDDDRPRTMHSASINPGNSGGPLVDELGRLVGVNIETLYENPFTRAEGMHLAVTMKDIHTFLGD